LRLNFGYGSTTSLTGCPISASLKGLLPAF
jgi:hypothetical protein